MSIMHCDYHGYWENEVWTSCPGCSREERENRKTFFGMTAVGWYLFLYIAVVLIAMAWIVIAHVPGGT